MPNYIQIRISYDDDSPNYDANKVKFHEMLAFMGSKKSKFDFNNLIPMPIELEGTRSPSNVVKDENYEALHAREVDKYKGDSAHGFSISASQHKHLIANYGVDNWYDWCTENWGTKWNAGGVESDDDCIMFQTAWTFPIPVIEALSKKFPEVLLKIDYADEDYGCNCGITEWLNGEITSSDIAQRNGKPKWVYFAELLHTKGDVMRLCRERYELNEQLRSLKQTYEPWRVD